MNINGTSLDATSTPAVGATVSHQAGMSNADVANNYNGGLSAGRGLLNTSSGFNSGLSYGDKATSDAIRSRYMPQYNLKENELRLNNMRGAQEDHLRNLQTATQAASQEVEMNKQKAMLKWKIDEQNRAARGAILGNILGIAGGIGGAAVAGPNGAAGGAMAGYQLGSGVGNMAGRG